MCGFHLHAEDLAEDTLVLLPEAFSESVGEISRLLDEIERLAPRVQVCQEDVEIERLWVFEYDTELLVLRRPRDLIRRRHLAEVQQELDERVKGILVARPLDFPRTGVLPATAV
jgi:hypothetical protein